MKYIFYVYELSCGHLLNTVGMLTVNAYVYCPTCAAMVQIEAVATHSQEIDDLEELPE